MDYVDSILEPGERVIRVAQPHWVAFIPPAIMMGGSFGVSIIALLANSHSFALWWVLVVIFGVGAVHYLVLRATEFVITNRRVIMKTGFITRHTSEMNASKIESVDVSQSVLGRLMNFGTIQVHGTGSDITPFRLVADPLSFRRAILSAPS